MITPIVMAISSTGFITMLGFCIYYHYTRKNRAQLVIYSILLGGVIANLAHCLLLMVQ